MAKQGKEMTPRFSETFRAFKECPWHKLHTVLLGQDPYSGKISKGVYVADGLAFSSRNSTKCPKSLEHIYRAVDRDIYKGTATHLTDTFDLTKWANQGILLLNTALSFPIGQKSAAHVNLWHPFITYVLKTINQRKDCIAFGLMGSYAKAYKNLLTNETFAIYDCEHPAAVEYRLGGRWDDEGIFRSIDAFQRTFNNIKINW